MGSGSRRIGCQKDAEFRECTLVSIGRNIGRNCEKLNHVPQTVLALKGSDIFSKDQGRRRQVSFCSSCTDSFKLDQQETVLGDTCSHLIQTKQAVASSNINIYNRTSTFFRSTWLLRQAGHQACHWGSKIIVWGLAMGLSNLHWDYRITKCRLHI